MFKDIVYKKGVLIIENLSFSFKHQKIRNTETGIAYLYIISK